MAAAPDPDVYCTMGHGCDLIDEPRRIVPPGCKYITSEICGRASIDLPKILIAFTDPLLIRALKHPEHPTILRVLSEYLQLTGDSVLRVRNEGEEYTESVITLWTPSGGHYFKSGIYQLGHVRGGPVERSIPVGEQVQHHPAFVDEGTRRFVYEDSLFPMPSRLEDVITLRYSDIMSTNPGIYYHLACRVVCQSVAQNPVNVVAFKRKQSINQLRRKGAVNQIGPVPINNQRGFDFDRTFLDWERYHINSPMNRERWGRAIQAALDEIDGRSTSAISALNNNAELPNYVNVPVVSAVRASNNNDELPNYVNVIPPASVAASVSVSNSNNESNSNNKSNSNNESNLNEETREIRNRQRQQNKLIRAIFRESRSHGGRKTYRKKTNKKHRRTHKRK